MNDRDKKEFKAAIAGLKFRRAQEAIIHVLLEKDFVSRIEMASILCGEVMLNSEFEKRRAMNATAVAVSMTRAKLRTVGWDIPLGGGGKNPVVPYHIARKKDDDDSSTTEATPSERRSGRGQPADEPKNRRDDRGPAREGSGKSAAEKRNPRVSSDS